MTKNSSQLASFWAKNWVLFFLLVAICIFLVLSLYHLSFPGLYYDELHFLNAALGDIDGTFIFLKFGKVPIYVAPYVGALKAWIYAPLLYFLKVSASTIRLPMILFAVVGLVYFFQFARKNFSDKAALYALFLLVINPVFLWSMRVDMGPQVMEFTIQVLATYLFFLPTRNRATVCTIFLGTFNRITFLWWFFGFFVAGFSFYKEKKSLLLQCALTVFLCFFSWLFFFSGELGSLLRHFSLINRVHILNYSLSRILDGSIVYRQFLGSLPEELFPRTGLYLLFMLAAAVYLPKKAERKLNIRLYHFLLTQVLLTTVVIILNRRAISYWHFIHLLPWILLLIGAFLSEMGKAGALIFALLFVELCSMHSLYLRAMQREPELATWSPAIYELMNFCGTGKNICVSVDWGTHLPILSTSRDPARSWEYPRNSRFSTEPFYVFYAHDLKAGERNENDFLYKSAAAGWEVIRDRGIPNNENPVFELYRLKKANADR